MRGAITVDVFAELTQARVESALTVGPTDVDDPLIRQPERTLALLKRLFEIRGDFGDRDDVYPRRLEGTPFSSSHEVVPFGTMPAN